MSLKIFVVGKDDSFRDSIVMHINDLGHTAIPTEAPESCPHYHSNEAFCDQDSPCGDAIILMENLPAIKGVDFVQRRINGGCKGAVKNNAVIIGPWSENAKNITEALGFHFFKMPFRLDEITVWLSEIERIA